MKIYLDNAATTPIDPSVLEAMEPYLNDHFGNPSSIHSFGREARSAVELSRRKIADLLNTSPSEIFFTSGGTEADNTAIFNSIHSLGIKNAITSKIEHPAVLHTLEYLNKTQQIDLLFVKLDKRGAIEYDHLEQLLKKFPGCFVSLMHANNEIANLNDLNKIGELCGAHGAIFHSDTVQSMGHFKHDLQSMNIHSIVGSAHKFHGPKGIGFLYLRNDHKINPMIIGGSQERNMRGGTENVYGIVGIAKALEIAYQEMSDHADHIKKLKTRMIKKLVDGIPGVKFNGHSSEIDNSLYKVLNVSLPPNDGHEMLLFNLDINGISASGGSACASGTNVGSHVLEELDHDPKRAAIRFSFSKYNTLKEIDYTVENLQNLMSK